MKFSKEKSFIFSIIFSVFCLLLSAFLIIAATKLVPNAITYTASTTENTGVSDENFAKDTLSCQYDSIYAFSEDGPFKINAVGDGIYIFSNGVCLYRIKANLGQFPVSDKESILSGLDIENKALLWEIVEYMES